MSNLIYACWRDAKDALGVEVLKRIADRIAAPGLDDASHQMSADLYGRLCLTGPVGAAVVEGFSARLGAFTGRWPEWHVPGSEVPDGSFALVRPDAAKVELCADYSGSRTLWYALTETRFFASTSQRALVCLLGGFHANKAAVGWFLSSGSLGPSDSWDARISRLPAGARLVFDRKEWRLDLRTAPPVFRPRPMKAADCRDELAARLREAVRGYDFQSGGWVLPLSGGVDSRCLLLMLHETGGVPPAVTWGLAASIHQKGNDAMIARQLARRYGVHHEYLHTEHAPEPPVEVVDRFLFASGGTTDQLPGYLDGLRIWSAFAERGVKGIIRGDAGFNGEPAHSMAQARTSSNLVLLSDFLDAETVDWISDGRQTIPDELHPAPGESIGCYCDRVFHAFGLPVVLAALSDVKAPFVEIASPMLSRRVLEFIREMPDAYRQGRSLYAELVRDLEPAIPFSTMDADDNREDYLDSAPYLHWLDEELSGGFAERLYPETFRLALLADLRRGRSPWKPSRAFRAAVKRVIPSIWIRAIRARLGEVSEIPRPRQLALRAALTCRVIRMLEEDARLLARKPVGDTPA